MADLEINDRAFSHASAQIKLDGVVYVAIKSIHYNDGMEPGYDSGTSAQDLVQTLGKYSADGDFEMWQSQASEFIASFGDDLYTKRFHVVATYEDDGLALRSRTLFGCRITKVEEGSEAGSDPNVTKFTVKPKYILRDGKKPFRALVEG